MNINVLTPLAMTVDGRVLTPSAPKQRSVLALLALRHGRTVTTVSLIEELWGETPPVSALATLQTYIYQLRRIIGTPPGSDGSLLITRPLGYVLNLAPENLDWTIFSRLLNDGRQALAEGDPERAAARLDQALELFPGEPLADLDVGPLLSAHVNELREGRLQALELRIEAGLALGQHRELISQLRTLTAEHPFYEGFHAKLMISLDGAGRRSEALDVYQQLRTNLVDELGIEPSAELRTLQVSLLSDEDATRPAPPVAANGASHFARPAQLPPDTADFVGQADTLGAIERLVGAPANRVTMPVVAITGVAAVGKTTVAIRAGHRVRARYPDGQFHADLRGSTDAPADPFDILGGFLRAAGLRGHQLPDTLDERRRLFRSWTADRGVLVLVDDARNAAQVRPLLPAGPHCAVLVTSRSLLPGLAGAQPVEVTELGTAESVELLARVAGRRWTADEMHIVRTIVRYCCRLPLAVRAMGAKLMVAPGCPPSKLAERLADPGRRLKELRFSDLDLTARLMPMFEQLDGDARDLLVGMAQSNAQTFAPSLVATMMGWDPMAAEWSLELLAESRFVVARTPDAGGEPRFVLPELVRAFAVERATVHRDAVLAAA